MELSGIDSVFATRIAEASRNLPRPETLEEASRQFEAIFLRQFLGDALKPILHEAPGMSGQGSQIYNYMITDAIAGKLSESGAFGFSSLLQMQLAGGMPDDPAGSEPVMGERKNSDDIDG